jgi:nicotinate dehydrogenase subunit A
MAKSVSFTLNGRKQQVAVDDPNEPLLYVLRDRFNLDGPKFGCGLAQCNACAVLFDGVAVPSCQYPIGSVEGATVTTVEGLGNEHKPHPVQTAFIAEQAAQCGYCTSGMIVSAAALLKKTPHPSDTQIKTALEGNLCRCASHLRIVRAVKRAAAEGTKTA